MAEEDVCEEWSLLLFDTSSSYESITLAKAPSGVGCRDVHIMKMGACVADAACVESVRATKKIAPYVSSRLEAYTACDVKALFGELDVEMRGVLTFGLVHLDSKQAERVWFRELIRQELASDQTQQRTF